MYNGKVMQMLFIILRWSVMYLVCLMSVCESVIWCVLAERMLLFRNLLVAFDIYFQHWISIFAWFDLTKRRKKYKALRCQLTTQFMSPSIHHLWCEWLLSFTQFCYGVGCVCVCVNQYLQSERVNCMIF